MQYATGVSNLGRVFKTGAGSAVFLNALQNTTCKVYCTQIRLMLSQDYEQHTTTLTSTTGELAWLDVLL
jgi:mRNA-degrading endonuclease toxin of MazEF toxin-antitoxin module